MPNFVTTNAGAGIVVPNRSVLLKEMMSSIATCKRYILTLESTDQRLVQSKEKLLSSGLGAIEVYFGIDGRSLPAAEYYETMVRAYAKHRQIITPAEVGCALSHLELLKKFLSSDKELAIVFEDDVLLGERSVEMLLGALELIRPRDILVACSQQTSGYSLRGLQLAARSRCYEVQKDDWGLVKRSCAYVVGREAAQHILRVQNECLWPADEFRVFCPEKGRLLFCSAFSHPAADEASNIENERLLRLSLLPPRSLILRLADELKKTIAAKGAPLKRAVRSTMGGYRGIEE